MIYFKLDFAKAYDKMSWTFFLCCQKLGLFVEFIKMVQLFFKDVEVVVNFIGVAT